MSFREFRVSQSIEDGDPDNDLKPRGLLVVPSSTIPGMLLTYWVRGEGKADEKACRGG
jgi:hypothetical protein